MAPLTRSNTKKLMSNGPLRVSLNSKIIKNKKESLKWIDRITKFGVFEAEKILLYLKNDDAIAIWNSSERWRKLMTKVEFWKKRCILDNLANKTEKSEILSQFLKKFDCYWQGLYIYNHTLLYNWKNSNFKKTMSSYTGNIFHHMNEKYIITSDFNILFNKNDIKIWDSVTGNLIKSKVGGHTDTILNVFQSENVLITFCDKKIMKIWDLSENGLCILAKRFTHNFFHVSVAKNVIAFTLINSTEIFVYDFKGTLIYFLDIKLLSNSLVKCLDVHENMLVFSTYDKDDVHLVEFNSGQDSLPIHVFSQSEISTIIIKNGYLLCYLYSGMIRVYDMKTWAFMHEFNTGRKDCTGIMFLEENKLVSNEKNRYFVSVWNFATGVRISQIRSKYVMDHLASNNRFIVVKVPYLKAIQVWCRNTNNLITQIPFAKIDLIGSVKYACVTETKLALLCFGRANNILTAYLIVLNFESNMVNYTFDYD